MSSPHIIEYNWDSFDNILSYPIYMNPFCIDDNSHNKHNIYTGYSGYINESESHVINDQGSCGACWAVSIININVLYINYKLYINMYYVYTYHYVSYCIVLYTSSKMSNAQCSMQCCYYVLFSLIFIYSLITIYNYIYIYMYI